MSEAGLCLCGVSLTPPGSATALFSGLNVQVGPGALAAVMGGSGCGKSSLLAWIGGFLDPGFKAAGTVRLDGVDLGRLPPEHRRVGILFQDDVLFPHLTVGGNLAFGLPAGLPRNERRRHVWAALEQAGLVGFADRHPATLSGGQRARVALLRMLLSAPRALLLDEPFSKLDQQLRGEFRQFVAQQAQQFGLPVLLVTHDEADLEITTLPPLRLPRSG